MAPKSSASQKSDTRSTNENTQLTRLTVDPQYGSTNDTAEERKDNTDPHASPPPYEHSHHHSNDKDIKSSVSKYTQYLDRYFHLTERGTTVQTEVRAGLVTFVTMAYILVVNPDVLHKSGTPHDPFPFSAIATATAMSACIGSLLVGLWGNLPFGLAPGMGLNSYFTYGVCLKLGLSWRVALTASFFQGLAFTFLAMTGTCSFIQRAAPPSIKKSITLGLGLFQALIGFESMKLVVSGQEDGTLLALGDMSDPRVWLSLVGMFLICALLVLDVKAAMIIGLATITIVSWVADLAPYPTTIAAIPTVMSYPLDFTGFFQHYHSTIPVTLTILFVAIFDTAGVQWAAASTAGLLDKNGHVPGSKAAFASAGVATTLGALLGTSPVIIHNETISGLVEGGRTGLTAVIIAVCFLISMPFIPLLESVPSIASAAPLVIVGMFMMSMGKYIDWDCVDEALPAFLTATILPFTYSIANGMMFGIISFAAIKLVAKSKSWRDGTPAAAESEASSDAAPEHYQSNSPETPSMIAEREAATPLLGLSGSPFTPSNHLQRRFSSSSAQPRQSPPPQQSQQQHHLTSPYNQPIDGDLQLQPPVHQLTSHSPANHHYQAAQLRSPTQTNTNSNGRTPNTNKSNTRLTSPNHNEYVHNFLGLPSSHNTHNTSSDDQSRRSFGTKYQDLLPII